MGVVRALSVLVSLVITLGVVSAAGAQYAPAGNEQPRAQALSAVDADARAPVAVDPFVVGPAPSRLTQLEKERFAKALDLSPARGLAVYHSGRVKVLDSLARETLSTIAERTSWFDLVAEGNASAPGAPGAPGAASAAQTPGAYATGADYRRVAYDPTFTLLDMAFDPGFYDDKAIVAVNLSARRALLERVFPGAENADRLETYKRLGRVKPVWVRQHIRALVGEPDQSDAYRAGLNQIQGAMNLWRNSVQNFRLVPGATPESPWAGVWTLDPNGPAGAAWSKLGDAWRAGDSAEVNRLVAVLGAELPKLSPITYPGVRRDVELWYNRAKPFEWGAWLYAGSLVLILLGMATGRAPLRVGGVALLGAAVLVHAIGFAARCYVAERYSIQNQFESMTGVSLFAALVGLGLLVFKRSQVFAAAAAGAGFLILITATQTGIPGQDINREAAILNTSVLLKYHVTTVLFSYGLITLGMVVSLFYLATYYATSRGAALATGAAGTSAAGASASGTSAAGAVASIGAAPDAMVGSQRVLHELDRAQNTILQLAFWTLGVGILLGAWWADHSWGRWWAFDPKELWALVTWIVYLIVVHVRVAGVAKRGLVTAWLSVLGFLAMLWCYFGVNLLLPGLHAYA